MVQQKRWTLLLSSTWCLWRQHFPGRGTGERSRESLLYVVLIPGSRVRSSTYLWSRQGKRETVVMRGPSQSLCLEVAKVEVPYFVKGATSWERSVLELGVYVRIHKLVTETCVNTFYVNWEMTSGIFIVRNKIWGMPSTWNVNTELGYNGMEYLSLDVLTLWRGREKRGEKRKGGSQPSRKEKLL